jgi:tellurite methyltransferase
MARDIGPAKTEDRRRDKTGETEKDCSEERLSHEEVNRIMSPSPFIVEWIGRIARERGPGGAALDVAMGRGRHTIALARAGFRAFGVDINAGLVVDAAKLAAAEGLSINAWCADLTAHPLPVARFAVAVVARYLQRDLFPALGAAVAPGGTILYETFTTAQLRFGTGPRSPDHLLTPGELRRRFEGFEILFYEEVDGPDAVARIAARRVSKSEVGG